MTVNDYFEIDMLLGVDAFFYFYFLTICIISRIYSKHLKIYAWTKCFLMGISI